MMVYATCIYVHIVTMAMCSTTAHLTRDNGSQIFLIRIPESPLPLPPSFLHLLPPSFLHHLHPPQHCPSLSDPHGQVSSVDAWMCRETLLSCYLHSNVHYLNVSPVMPGTPSSFIQSLRLFTASQWLCSSPRQPTTRAAAWIRGDSYVCKSPYLSGWGGREGRRGRREGGGREGGGREGKEGGGGTSQVCYTLFSAHSYLLLRHAVVPDEGEGESEDLVAVRRVSQRLHVPHHARLEHCGEIT